MVTGKGRRGFLGIDAGTQGLTVVLTDADLNVLGTGDGHYEMLPNLQPGCYQQNADDWLAALQEAMADLRSKIGDDFQVLAVGVSGQMHGEVIADQNGQPVGSVRLWCDSRNADEEAELTEFLGVKMPKRMTAVRWLWTTRHQPEKARMAARLTTPSGWLAWCLSGQWNLGIGDAAGMFPVDQATMDYDRELLAKFESKVEDDFQPLSQLLPHVRLAGQSAGNLNQRGCEILGLPIDSPNGVPLAAAEGDQPAAMAGSLLGQSGSVSVSFGTSVCANSIGDRPFLGVSPAVDHFCAPDGKPINMVFLRNGTTFMNAIVKMFANDGCEQQEISEAASTAFDRVIPQVLRADEDCGGILALPFMDDEPGLSIRQGGMASVVGLNDRNANPGNLVKAAMLATMFNLRMGSQQLQQQGFPQTEIILTGGLTRTPRLAQILADVFDVPVSVPSSADEGTAWGAAVLAKFRHSILQTAADELGVSDLQSHWVSFLQDHRQTESSTFVPDKRAHEKYSAVFQRYKALVGTHFTSTEVV